MVWATVPQVHRGLADWALFLATVGVAAGALRLALTAVPVPEDSFLLPAGLRVWLSFLETLRKVPWEEGALIAAGGLVLPYVARHPGTPDNPTDHPSSRYPQSSRYPSVRPRACRDIQEGHGIPRSSWGPGAYDEPGQAGRWGFTRTNRRAGPDG